MLLCVKYYISLHHTNKLKNENMNTPTKKITLATVKSFIKKNSENLFVKMESSFDGMTDMVEFDKNAQFKLPE